MRISSPKATPLSKWTPSKANELAAKYNLDPEYDLYRILKRHIALFENGRSVPSSDAHHRSLREKYGKVHRHAVALQHALKILEYSELAALLSVLPDSDKGSLKALDDLRDWKQHWDAELESLRQTADTIVKAAAVPQTADAKPRGGRPTDIVRRTFLAGIVLVYKEASGKRKWPVCSKDRWLADKNYRPPVLKFADEVVSLCGERKATSTLVGPVEIAIADAKSDRYPELLNERLRLFFPARKNP